MAQQNRGPVVLAQSRDRLFKLAGELLGDEAIIRRLLVGFEAQGGRFLALRGQRIRGPVHRNRRQLPLAQVIDREVIGDFEQPGGETVRAVVAVEVVERADEHLLRKVLGQFPVANHSVDDGEYGTLESLNQLASGSLITAPTESDELLVGLPAVVQSGSPLPLGCFSAGVAAPSVPPYRGGNLDAGPVPRQQESRESRALSAPGDMPAAQSEERLVRVGLISDIHGKLRPEVFELLAGVDRILYAGDVERAELLDELEVIAPVDAVWETWDGHSTDGRLSPWAPSWKACNCCYPQDLVALVNSLLKLFPTADVIVHGHSHVPRCDRWGSRWIVNPGAATKPRSGHPASVAIARVDDGEVEITHLSLADGAPFTP